MGPYLLRRAASSLIYSSFVYSSYLGAGVEWHVLIPPSPALSIFAAAFYLVATRRHRVADHRLRQRWRC